MVNTYLGMGTYLLITVQNDNDNDPSQALGILGDAKWLQHNDVLKQHFSSIFSNSLLTLPLVTQTYCC